MDIRTNSISARRLIKKLPAKQRPTENDLYRFFEGNKSRIPIAIRQKMIEKAKEDLKEMEDYLLNE